ncbi:NAD-dependent epimerase/dehydratase family protein [Parerythrobacter aestuarii]|uniref:NAD-dependent epimerase/dehydratase family protein n=1 Tax=Parerythrobacter aestuarii TaxID=3020909 RepID=UPI0024DED873|nr:NAD-dependent epimerase/dehydratase family protein [Parerythrobacter aestuarii]
MRVLVVGGTGMVGVGVVDQCIQAGHEVTLLHRGQSTHAFLETPASTILIDRKQGAFSEFLQQQRFEVIIDLACYTADEAAELIEAVPIGQRIVTTSTVLVNGGGIPRPITESSQVSVLTEYASAKYEMEQVFNDATIGGRVSSLILRLGACYREGCYLDGQLFEDDYWIAPLVTGGPSVLADDGSALWNVLHSNDAGTAIARLIERPEAFGRTVLLANPETISWRDYYELCAKSVGGIFKPIGIPSDWLIEKLGPDCFLAEMSSWDQRYDLTLLESLIGPFEPRIDLHGGLAKAMIALATENQGAPNDSNAEINRLLGEWKKAQSHAESTF